jgi:MFS transporter, DHA1 family, tetracycline resistance protein
MLQALFALCTGYYTYFAIFVAEGPLQLGGQQISLLFLYFAGLGLVSNTLFFGKIAERINTKRALRAMFGTGVFVMLLYAVSGPRLWFVYFTLTIDMLTISLAPGLVEGMIGNEADEDSVGEVFGLAQGLASLLGLLSIGLYTATSIIDLRLPFVVFAIPLVMAWFLVARLNTPETAKTAEAA